MSLPAAICTITHNAASDLPDYLAAVGRLAYDLLELVIVDSASTDDSAAIARQYLPASLPARVIELGQNVGFAAGMNRAIESTSTPYILSLNADTRPDPNFARALVRRLETETGRNVGAVTGRLARPRGPSEDILDAAGMRLVPTWRHLDRGSGDGDRGQFGTAEAVFGGTGAATLFYRPALDDVAVDGEFFLSEFHSYREDAELCFRLRERGWEVLFEPSATAVHRRTNVPDRRRQMPAQVNYHSLKNRFLLRAYHETGASFVVAGVPSLLRDLGILGYVLGFERSSLAAYSWLWNHRHRIRARRKVIQDRRTVSSRQVAKWFLKSAEPL